MDYETYKNEYQLRTDNIDNLDVLIASNTEKREKTNGDLTAARERQNELSDQTRTAPENTNLDAIASADRDVARLGRLSSALDQQHSDLESARTKEFGERDKLQHDNPECKAQGLEDGFHKPDAPDAGPAEQGGVMRPLGGTKAKFAGIGMTLIGAAQDVEVHPGGHHGAGDKAIHGSQDPHEARVEAPHAPHQPHTHDEKEVEPDRRAQTTTKVEPDPPPGGTSQSYQVDATFGSQSSGLNHPPSGEDKPQTITDRPPEPDTPFEIHKHDMPAPQDPLPSVTSQTYEVENKPQTITDRPPEPDTPFEIHKHDMPAPQDPLPSVTSQTYEIEVPSGGGSHSYEVKLSPPSDDVPASVPGGGRSNSQPLAGPRDSEPLLLTSDRENQKLLTDQRGSVPDVPEPIDPPPGGGAAAAPAVPPPPPGDDIPAAQPEINAPPPNNEIQM